MTELQPAAGGPAGGIAQRGGTWPGQGGACGVVRAPRPDGKPLPPPNKPPKVPASVSASASAPAPFAASVAAAAAAAAATAAVTMAEEEVKAGGTGGLSRGGERMHMLELPGGHVLLQAREHARPMHCMYTLPHVYLCEHALPMHGTRTGDTCTAHGQRIASLLQAQPTDAGYINRPTWVAAPVLCCCRSPT